MNHNKVTSGLESKLRTCKRYVIFSKYNSGIKMNAEPVESTTAYHIAPIQTQ